MRSVKIKLLSLLALAVLGPSVWAFSLLQPYAAWMDPALGYQLRDEIGGPGEPQAFYRWNITNITYAFDKSFIDYFGVDGMKAVDAAFKILNDLPPSSQLDINQYPLDSRMWNPQAEQARLIDLKSTVLSVLLEEMGLANPEHYIYAMRYRYAVGNITNYYIVGRNYDPMTLRQTNAVNEIHYTYTNIIEGTADYPIRIVPFTSTDRMPYSSVASGNIAAGNCYAGLTRDDVGGLKFLLSTNTLAIESLLPDVTPGGPVATYSMGWIPYMGTTNVVSNYFTSTNFLVGTNGTNLYVTNGIRGGVNKITFTKVEFDDMINLTFKPITNYYDDIVIITNKLIKQQMTRVITQPDIVFQADHLGFRVSPAGWEPLLLTRTDTTGWINNDDLNGRSVENGPGLITGQIVITLTEDLGGYLNVNPYYTDELSAYKGELWGSFDNTTTPPIVFGPGGAYPLTVDELLRLMITATNGVPRNP